MQNNPSDADIEAAYGKHKTGDLVFAEKIYRAALQHRPNHPVALQYIALIQFARDDHGLAISSLKKSIASDPNRAAAHAELGRLYALMNEPQLAVEGLLEALQIDPELSDAWHNLGLVRGELADTRGAFEAFRTALRTNPKRTDSMVELAKLLHKEGQLADAKRALEIATKPAPDDVATRLLLAQIVAEMSHTQDALDLFRAILRDAAQYVDAWVSFGQVLEDHGDQAEAIDAYRQALKLEPNSGIAIGGLLSLLPQDEKHELVALGQSALNSETTPDETKALVGYGLGRTHDRDGTYDSAFAAFSLANEARERVAGAFDLAELQARVERYKAGIPLAAAVNEKALGQAPARPVFIVGMPRSGTTLTEQILSSVPGVHGAGELPTINEVSKDLEALCVQHNGRWPNWLSAAPAKLIQQARQTYFAKLTDGCEADAQIAIDKLPLNFFHLGFIEAVFPEARIIHCRRDPRDVCWSIFTQNFAHAQKHSTSLTALGQYWNCYDQLMRHWSGTLSLPMIEVQYEETIADVEAMSRRLCEFIGVEWDAQAVDFHKSDRTVRTPSRWQVRQPIYKSSAGKWKRYEKHLGPLIEALKM